MKHLLFLLLSIWSLNLAAQKKLADSTANCIAYWNKNEKKTYIITREKTSYDQGVLKSKTNFVYEAHIEVVDSTEKTYTIHWIFKLPEDYLKANPSLGDANFVYNGMTMKFETTNSGAFEELTNWEEVRDAYFQMMEMSIPNNPDRKRDSAIAKSKEMFANRGVVESALIREIQLFHFPYGYQFTTKEVKETTSLPTPFMEEPLPATKSYKVTEVNTQKDFFRLSIKQEINKSESKKLFSAVLKKFNITDEKSKQETLAELSSYEINDITEYQISLSTGWPAKIYFARSAGNSKRKQIDAYTIQVKK